MTMVLKENEVCPLIDCKYRKGSNGVGDCYGAKEERCSQFVCNLNDLKEGETPYFPDTTIRGKTLLQG